MQLKQPRKKVDCKVQEIVHPDAAGIDLGGSEHGVASVRIGSPNRCVVFASFTAALRERAAG